MSNTRVIQLSALLGAGFCLWAIAEGGILASAQQPIRIRAVDYPRPVAEAVLQVERHFGYPVTYEDTRYVHPSDIVDMTDEIRRDFTQQTRVLGRRKGTLDFTHTPRSGPVDRQVGEVLLTLLAHANATAGFGQFRVDRGSGGYHVVPVAIRGEKGRIEPYASPLETRITMLEDASGLEMMFRFTGAVTAFSGVTLGPGTMPLNRLEQSRVAVDAQAETARDILWHSLRSIDPKLSWQLLCDVGEEGACSLNVHFVGRR